MEQGSETKAWKYETEGIGRIENLHFQGDRKWNTCTVTVKGTKQSQWVTIVILADGKERKKESFHLKEGEEKQLICELNAAVSIDVTGELMNTGVFGGGGEVFVTSTYPSGEQYKREAVSWSDETGGTRCIKKLCLYNTEQQIWEKCEILLQGKKDKDTGCMVTLIADGALHEQGCPEWIELKGTQSKIYSFELHRKGPLLVAGYISSLALTGGGAAVKLTGYYK